MVVVSGWFDGVEGVEEDDGSRDYCNSRLGLRSRIRRRPSPQTSFPFSRAVLRRNDGHGRDRRGVGGWEINENEHRRRVGGWRYCSVAVQLSNNDLLSSPPGGGAITTARPVY